MSSLALGEEVEVSAINTDDAGISGNTAAIPIASTPKRKKGPAKTFNCNVCDKSFSVRCTLSLQLSTH